MTTEQIEWIVQQPGVQPNWAVWLMYPDFSQGEGAPAPLYVCPPDVSEPVGGMRYLGTVGDVVSGAGRDGLEGE